MKKDNRKIIKLSPELHKRLKTTSKKSNRTITGLLAHFLDKFTS